MKRISIVLFVASVAMLLFSLANLSPVVSAQLPMPKDDGGGSDPTGAPATPVEVTNALTGTMAVKNFPLRQEVFGTVDVGNLPLDMDGNLKTSSSSGPLNGHLFLLNNVVLDDTDLPASVAFVDMSHWRNFKIAFQAVPFSELPGPPNCGPKLRCRVGAKALGPPDFDLGQFAELSLNSPSDQPVLKLNVTIPIFSPAYEFTVSCDSRVFVLTSSGSCDLVAGSFPFQLRIDHLTLFLQK